MKVEKIHHVRIMVRDLDGTMKRWSTLFGLEFTPPQDNPKGDLRGTSSSVGVTLGAPLTPDGPVARGLEKRGEGLALLSLQVSNFDEALKEMEANGLKCVTNFGKAGLFHPKDLNGVMIELVQVT